MTLLSRNPVDFRTAGLRLLILCGLGGIGCSESEQSQVLRTLSLSDDISFVCRNLDRNEGARLEECPDRVDDGVSHELLALVNQTMTGEVAVLNFSTGRVVDVDPATPAPSFLPVGSSPVDVVTTPGGTASFVAVAEAGREGIYALPTSCVTKPEDGQPRRDLTLWPSCSLPTSPGSLQIVVQPPDSDGTVRASCTGGPAEQPAASGRSCPADLRTESAVAPAGRRLLAVTFPETGELGLLDAQSILDREPGSFEPCTIERRVQLEVRRPASGISQPLPPELISSECPENSVVVYPVDDSQAKPQPTEMTAGGGRLYIADRGAPVIHVIDVRDPCAPIEEPPLLPVSFEWPAETVTTRDLAVSPPTTTGEHFLYAIDDRDGSVMAFDLSPGARRTPLIHGAAQRLPLQPADRIAFGSPARAIAFVQRDVPLADDETGVALLSQHCDPAPDSDSAGTLYRTSSDYARGARPRKLRGLFGMVALANGRIAVIDIEDLDAPCRRPQQANPSAAPDAHGCRLDPDVEAFTDGNLPTVSSEASCNVVEPHQPRSAYFVLTSSHMGVHAPTLRSFPLLSLPEDSQPTSATDERLTQPKMLAVPPSETAGAAAIPSQVFVGTTLYETTDGAENVLAVDPAEAEHNSLILPVSEPRAYTVNETFRATYEGALAAERPSGRLLATDRWFVDPDTGFCNLGVQDERLAAEWAAELGVSKADREGFAKAYADYVQLSGDFDDEEPYWQSPAGRACDGGRGMAACEEKFGTAEDPSPARDLRIVEAYQDHLVVTPRARVSLDLVRCCFPSLSSYRLRASRQWIVAGSNLGFLHQISAGPDGRCVRDCNARKALFRGRALEISSTMDCPDDDTPCIGRADSEVDFACIVDRSSGEIVPGSGEVAEDCVFHGLHAHFAIYRGSSASARDMSFSWEVSGGFVPLTLNIATTTTGTSVLPQGLHYLGRTDVLVAVDAIAAGVELFDLNSLTILGQPFL